MKTKMELTRNPKTQAPRFAVLMTVGSLLAAAALIRAAEGQSAGQKALNSEEVRAAAKAGNIAFRLSMPEELERMLGKPQNQREEKNGDMVIRILEFPTATATFAKLREFAGPFTLYELKVEGHPVDIGRERPLVLRTVDDLSKLDTFWGLAGVSAAKLDLRDQLNAVEKLTFDSRTAWPEADKLPAGFNPIRLLEEGKNPGLGVRKLHAVGIDGRGVGIAIIDQPLLKEHEEYKDRIVELLKSTAVKTLVGTVINPAAVIESVKDQAKKG